MRVVVQRVAEASVEVDGAVVGAIQRGLLVLAAFTKADADEDLEWMARKCLELRIFEDEAGKMNRSVLDLGGEVLVVPQFTLYGDCRRGRRPDFFASAPAGEAATLYRRFVDAMRMYHPKVAEGVFGAKMKVHLLNDGPVTFVIDHGGESASGKAAR